MRSGIVSGINSGIMIGTPSGFRELKSGVRSGLSENYMVNAPQLDPSLVGSPVAFFLSEKIIAVGENITEVTNLIPDAQSFAFSGSPTFQKNSIGTKGSIRFSMSQDRLYLNNSGQFVNDLSLMFVANIDDNCTREIVSLTKLEAVPLPGIFDPGDRQGNCYLRCDTSSPGYLESRLLGEWDDGSSDYTLNMSHNSPSNRHVLRRRWNLFTLKFRFSAGEQRQELHINGKRITNNTVGITSLSNEHALDFTGKALSIGAPWLLSNYITSYDSVNYTGTMNVAAFAAFNSWIPDPERIKVENYFRRYYDIDFR